MTRGSASPAEHRELRARFASLTDAAAFADDFCTRHGIDRGLALKLTLVLEELLTNTITHGFGTESDAPIRISLTASNPQSVSLVFEDSAPPFDPLAHDAQQPAAVDDAFDTRSIGGLGIHLVGSLASAACYAYEDGCNRLRLTLSIDGVSG